MVAMLDSTEPKRLCRTQAYGPWTAAGGRARLSVGIAGAPAMAGTGSMVDVASSLMA